MAEAKNGIGYCVYDPSKDMFLGKLGVWYSDVRLAGVFAEPGKAKAAINRLEGSEKDTAKVREIHLSVKADPAPAQESVSTNGTPAKPELVKIDPKPAATPSVKAKQSA